MRNRIIRLSEVNSTMVFASELLDDDCPNGTVVIANSQTLGVGRKGRIFYSPKDVGIYLTMIVEIPEDFYPLNLLTSIAGLATATAINLTYFTNCKIKWPNDLILNGKKICGILTRLVTDPVSNKITHALIGIGINVSTNEEDLPIDIRTKATSIEREIKIRRPKESLINEVIQQLNNFLIDRKYDEDFIVKELNRQSCVLRREVFVPALSLSGIATEISTDGGLIIDKDGEKYIVNSGEIEVEGFY